jgi:hypothetical protein
VKEKLVRLATTTRLRVQERYLLSSAHWDRIFAQAKRFGARSRVAASRYASAYRYFHLGFQGASPEAIATARSYFGEAVMIDPGMCDAYLGLLLVRAFREGLEEAGERYELLEGIDDLGILAAAATTAHRFGEEQKAIGSPIQIVFSPIAFGQINVESGDDLRLYYASELYKAGEIQLAKEWLERVSMRNAKRYALQAKFCYFDSKFEEAIQLLGPVVSNSPELRLDALWLIATCLVCLGQPREAIEVVEAALAGITRHDRPYLFLSYAVANAHGQLGEDEQKRDILNDLFQINPYFLDVAQQLGLDLPDGTQASPEESAWQQIVSGLRSEFPTADDLLPEDH